MQAAEHQRLWNYTIGRRLAPFVLIGCVFFLNGLGLLMLMSIGRADGAGLGGYFLRQCLWCLMGLLAFGCAFAFDLDRWRNAGWWLASAGLVLLILVLVPGVGLKINGARRWLDLGPMNLQVSDVAKIGYIYCLAQYFSIFHRERRSFWKGFVFPVGIMGVFFGLIILQPDFGTAFLFAVVGGLLLFLAGTSLYFLIPAGLAGLALFSVAIYQDPVRLQRILSFMDVEGNRSAGAYQLWQGIIGFASGGVSGVGLGNGRQQFAFLPEAHTDFIFPIIGEELGLVFTLLVLFVFIVFFFTTWYQLQKAPSLYSFLLVSGALFFVTLQAIINMGVSMGLLPTKGMSLPFISYGGSNLVVSYLLVGIICRYVWQWNNPQGIEAREYG
jgi:cell division protein FtsW